MSGVLPPPLDIRPNRSRYSLRVAASLYGLSAVLILMSGLAWYIQLAQLIVLFAVAYYSYWRLNHPRYTSLLWRADGSIALIRRGEGALDAQEARYTGCFRSRYLIVLYSKTLRGKRVTLLVFCDSVSPNIFRKLLVRTGLN